jgi:hypothetical protein
VSVWTPRDPFATEQDESAAKKSIEQILVLPRRDATQHPAVLPTPTLTATIVYDQGRQPGRVVIGGESPARSTHVITVTEPFTSQSRFEDDGTTPLMVVRWFCSCGHDGGEFARGGDARARHAGTVHVTAASKRQAREESAKEVRRARKVHACSACGAIDHNSRNPRCPNRGAPP